MAGRSAWTAGNGAGLTYTALFGSSDMNSLATANTVLSSLTAIANQTNLDQLAAISYSLTISSSTIVAGATIAFYPYYLNEDGSTYGDNQFTAGTGSSRVPTVPPCAIQGIPALATTTTIVGTTQPFIFLPQSALFAIANNCGFTITSGQAKLITFNQNLNN